eukprot:TRINITY_DN50483_c0_g1_i1.p1 TRINITY_DN50483_c0_g1~~TRINITY_DN50483_c0_g1_i1.p1  ORF type:complete len:332 (-),score=40.34 TRINITY_DN50483_c0_g1_i1:96-1091(-)
MSRSYLISTAFLLAGAFLLLQLFDRSQSAVAFSSVGSEEIEAPSRSLLSYLPLYELTNRGHTGYPIPMMFGFTCRGNVELRKACGGKPYPSWMLGFLLGLICYTYPANVMSDALFAPGVLRGLSNNNILMCYSFWFVLVQSSERLYEVLISKHVYVLLTVWFIWDASHASLCFLERAVSPPLGTPVFSRGLFQCFVWCCAAAILGSAEKAIRGVPIPKLEALIPNHMDIFGHPTICMFWGMVFYMLYLVQFTDCGVFQQGGKSLFECGVEHPDLYTMCHYVPMALHVLRSYRGSAASGPSPEKKLEEGKLSDISNNDVRSKNEPESKIHGA